MKLRVPTGCCAVSHEGKILEIAEDGSIEVKKSSVMSLISHGLTPLDDKQRESGGGGHMAVAQSVRQPDQPGTGKPSRSLDTCVGAEAGITEPSAGINDISEMKRRELFTLLRAKGIRVSLPVTNDELRAAIRSAAGG